MRHIEVSMLSGATSIASYSQSHNGPLSSHPCINAGVVFSYIMHGLILVPRPLQSFQCCRIFFSFTDLGGGGGGGFSIR